MVAMFALCAQTRPVPLCSYCRQPKEAEAGGPTGLGGDMASVAVGCRPALLWPFQGLSQLAGSRIGRERSVAAVARAPRTGRSSPPGRVTGGRQGSSLRVWSNDTVSHSRGS